MLKDVSSSWKILQLDGESILRWEAQNDMGVFFLVMLNGASWRQRSIQSLNSRWILR